jgi:hypothetical protein
MATPEATNLVLDPSGTTEGCEILKAVIAGDGLTISYYVDGGTYAPGRNRWIDCTITDSAAVQAAAIKAAMIA